MIRLRHVTKSFTVEGKQQPLLQIPNLEIGQGEMVALLGESGSGKTTLLNLLSGLLVADSGVVEVAGKDLSQLTEHQRDKFRASHCGCVFQSFHLLDGYSAIENVELGAVFSDQKNQQTHARALELLDSVGLSNRLRHHPSQLSIGQQARVALARALINKPQVLLADEPTGSLDPANREAVLQLLLDSCSEHNITLVCVTHDSALANHLGRVVKVEDFHGGGQ